MNLRARVGLAVIGVVALVTTGSPVALAVPRSVAPSASVPSTVASSEATAPVAQGSIGVQVWPGGEPGKTVLTVSIALDQKTPLPARVRIPVPPGTTVIWAGEVLGGDVNDDPARRYTLRDGAGGAQYAEFTLSQSFHGQVDAVAGPLTTEDGSLSARVSFVQAVANTSTRFTVRLPAGASNVKIDPAPPRAPEVNASGESLYTVGDRSLPVGGRLQISVSYTQAGTESSAKSRTPPSAILVVLVIALVVLIAVIVLVARFMPADKGSEGDEDDEGDEDSEDVLVDEDEDDEDLDAYDGEETWYGRDEDD